MNSIYDYQDCNEDISQFHNHVYSQLDFNTTNEIMLEEKKFLSQVISVIQKTLSKKLNAAEEESTRRLKSKDEEIIGLKRLNYMLLEQMKNLELENKEETAGLKRLNYMLAEQLRNTELENNAWKLVAQNYESNAAALKQTVEKLLAEREVDKDDCESCCDDNYSAACSGEECRFEDQRCAKCEKGVPSVLLLPCKHLCLCVACAALANFCPICNCAKRGSVNLNLL